MSNRAQEWAKAQNVGNSGAKFVLWILADYAGPDGGSCFPTIKSICSDTEMGERTISRHLDYLEEGGFIDRWRSRHTDGTLGRYNYRLNMRPSDLTAEPPAKLTSGQIDQWPKTTKPPANLAGHKPSIKPSNKKEKNTLTREEFLWGVEEGFRKGDFSAFDWLTWTEVKDQADACLDHYGNKGESPAGEPAVVVRHWIRKGVADGKIRQRPIDRNALRGEQADNAAQEPAEEWQRIFFNRIGADKFRLWIKPLVLDGASLIAPSSFHKNWVSNHYSQEIKAAFPHGVEIVVGQGDENHATG